MNITGDCAPPPMCVQSISFCPEGFILTHPTDDSGCIVACPQCEESGSFTQNEESFCANGDLINSILISDRSGNYRLEVVREECKPDETYTSIPDIEYFYGDMVIENKPECVEKAYVSGDRICWCPCDETWEIPSPPPRVEDSPPPPRETWKRPSPPPREMWKSPSPPPPRKFLSPSPPPVVKPEVAMKDLPSSESSCLLAGHAWDHDRNICVAMQISRSEATDHPSLVGSVETTEPESYNYSYTYGIGFGAIALFGMFAAYALKKRKMASTRKRYSSDGRLTYNENPLIRD